MIPVAAMTLVVGGALILLGSMVITRRLIARLPQGPLRKQWFALLTLVLVFFMGYLGYAWVFSNRHTQPLDLFVPSVFFMGACFVWLTSRLSLETALAVVRISLLEQENISDPLTGVFNRRYLDRRLGEEVTRARRYGLPLSVLLLDIDHFKRINDEFGHQAGDQVLAAFAELVGRQLREPDVLTRYGGEEFMVIATQTPHRSAFDLAERLRAAIQQHRFRLHLVHGEAVEIRLTCSMGAASLDQEVDQAAKLVGTADENLYRAKHEGRNRVCDGRDSPQERPTPQTVHCAQGA